jgi:MraZ protein
MLIGEYRHTIDTKKRLALPAKFRRELGKKVVITRGFEGCLVIYSEKKWESESSKLENLPTGRRDARGVNRIFLAGASEVNMDSLGRVLIPEYLKKYAELKKNVVICGLSNKLEVWDSRKWDIYRKKVEKDIDNISEKLGDFGI